LLSSRACRETAEYREPLSSRTTVGLPALRLKENATDDSPAIKHDEIVFVAKAEMFSGR
jgi:hypothetical protein